MKAAAILVLIGGFCSQAPRSETMIFDFEEADDAGRWSPMTLPELKEVQPAPAAELSSDHATSGTHSLEITFRAVSGPLGKQNPV